MRRGQIEFGESLMVVIILVFLLIIGIVFYFNVSKNSLKNEVNYREDIESVKLAKNVLALPEIQCSSSDAVEGCIDELKLEALATVIRNDAAAENYYGQLFGYANITVSTLSTGAPSFILYQDRPSGNSSATPQTMFTTLLDPRDGSTSLAYINVTRYTPEVR
jgi:hypothetical protein